MARCALTYVAIERQPAGQPAAWTTWRIDFIAVEVERGRVRRLEHYKHALQ
jgi:hypothetical protein